MKMNVEVLRQGIENLAVGASDEEIDNVLRRAAAAAAEASEPKVKLKLKPAPLLDQMADIGQARTWVMKADAFHDPDVAMLRALSERDRARVLLTAERTEPLLPWDGVLSRDVLVLPPRDTGRVTAISIASLKASESPFYRLALWFARAAMRISMEYRIQPEFAFGFLLLDSFWRPMPWVGVQIERFGAGESDARIYLDIDSTASDEEVYAALRRARVELGASQPLGRKRELRAKTVALAFQFAAQLAEGEFESTSVDWETLLLIWNAFCEIEGRSSWAYNTKSSSGNPAHQFSRDVKHALEAVRGRKTSFTILGARKRKPVN